MEGAEEAPSRLNCPVSIPKQPSIQGEQWECPFLHLPVGCPCQGQVGAGPALHLGLKAPWELDSRRKLDIWVLK